MARSIQSRDFRREEDKIIAGIDRQREIVARTDTLPPGFLPRQSSVSGWRIPLRDMIPGLDKMFEGMFGGDGVMA